MALVLCAKGIPEEPLEQETGCGIKKPADEAGFFAQRQDRRSIFQGYFEAGAVGARTAVAGAAAAAGADTAGGLAISAVGTATAPP